MEPDIRQLVTDIRQARGLSIAELATLLGYKSQTSVMRVIQDKVSAENLNRFCHQLMESDQLRLTAQERKQVEQLLEFKRLGPVEYSATQMLRQLLQADPPLVDPVLLDPQTGSRQTLLSRYLPMTGLKITVVNCETMALFTALAVLTRQNRATVEHYLYSDKSLRRTVLAVRAVLPILHDPNYWGGMTIASREFLLDNPRGILLSDVLICRYRKDDVPCLDLVVFQSKTEGLRFSFPGEGKALQQMLEPMKAKAQPLRNTRTPSAGKNYAAFLRSCAEMERDRAAYRIKPDFGFEQVPVHIWKRALLEGPAAGSGAIGDIDELVQICLRRQENAFNKKQPQHHVFKRRAVWKFLETGRLSDQFWAFRPLTMEERLQVLQTVMDLQLNNPYYSLYFLKDEDGIRNDELLLLDGLALCLIKPGTDYDLTSGHSEAFVTQPDFLRLYRSFFLRSVLAYDVLPEEETIGTLREMMAYCRQHLDK